MKAPDVPVTQAVRALRAAGVEYINGGKRGFLVGIAPAVLTSVLAAIPVQVGVRLG